MTHIASEALARELSMLLVKKQDVSQLFQVGSKHVRQSTVG